ncbi:MAG: A24 family peptidase [Candidatus Nanoarchaeia archaeon]|nr:A24 family peptidase [Candidatus Nanoarchaeia archaeon]
MIFLLLAVIGVIGLALASYFDIKTKEIPNIISFTMIALGLGLRLIYSIVTKEIMFFVYGLIAFGIFFSIGGILYYTKQWGGGDTKILMALGALYGAWSTKYFLISLILILVAVASIYGLIWAVYLSIKHRKDFKAKFLEIYKKNKVQILFVFIVSIGLIISSFFLESFMAVVLWIVAALILVYYHLLMYMHAVEKSCMEKTIPVSKLTEGDWILGTIKKGNKIIYSKHNPSVTKKQIELLKKHKISKVRTKDGFPFIPAFLIALILTFIFSSVVINFLINLI